jgi:hypothetical protein
MNMLTDDDKQWIEERLNHARLDLNEKLDHARLDLDEKLEGMETRLLTAFHGWASPVVARQQSHTAVLRALGLEVEDLKKRVEKLEKPAA